MIKIYTDGSSCHTKLLKGFGGSAAIVVYNNEIIQERGSYEGNQKSGFCELRAIEISLDLAWRHRDKNLAAFYEIHTDSTYAKNTILKWSHTWKALNWMRPTGDKVENLDLVKSLYWKYKRFPVDIIKVKAHSNHVFNDRADEVANFCRNNKKDYFNIIQPIPKVNDPFNIVLQL